MSLDLNVRDLQTGEQGTLTLDSVDAAKVWLADRPKFTEVLGVATASTSPRR